MQHNDILIFGSVERQKKNEPMYLKFIFENYYSRIDI